MKYLLLILLSLFGSSVVSAETKMVDKKYLEASSLLENYNSIYSEITQSEFDPSFVKEVIKRVCQSSFVNCKVLDVKKRTTLHSFKTEIINSAGKSVSESLQYSKIIEDLVADEKELLLWEQKMARDGRISKIFNDGNGPQIQNKINYTKKSTLFDLSSIVDSYEIVLFGTKKVSALIPKFLTKKDDLKPNKKRDADSWVHPKNKEVKETVSFNKNNGSISAQIKRLNEKVFKDILNQKPLSGIKNTKKAFQMPFVKTPISIPVTIPHEFLVPLLSQDKAESEILADYNYYNEFLESLENEKSCEESSDESNTSKRVIDVSNCELMKKFLWAEKIEKDYFVRSKRLVMKEHEKRMKIFTFTKFFTEFVFDEENGILKYLDFYSKILLQKKDLS